MIWTILGIAGVVVLAAIAILDKEERGRPVPAATEENLQRSLRALGIDVSLEEIAMMSDRDFDACWAFVDARRGGSAQSTTDPPMPACLVPRGRTPA